MKKLLVIAAVSVLFIAAILNAQSVVPNYYSTSGLLPAAGGVYQSGLYGLDNPAWLTTVRTPELALLYSIDAVNSDYGTHGGLTAAPGFGASILQTKTAVGVVNDYALAFAGGDRSFGIGVGYQWSSGKRAAYQRMDMLIVGAFARPNEFVSVGFSGRSVTHGDASQGVLDVGVRPFGTHLFALFADYAIDNSQTISNGNWSAGAVAEPLDGIRVALRYFDTQAISVGVNISLGGVGVGVHPTMDKNSKNVTNTVMLRVSGYDRNIFRPTFGEGKTFVKNSMSKPVSHTKGTFFSQKESLLDLMQEIEYAKNDPAIGGIVINTTTLSGGRTLLWEVREKLKNFRSSGKKVIMYIERGGIDTYHFASVADYIVMEPIGSIALGGYIMGRSYLKGTLEKVGIGYDEFRYFKYKSAAETFARDKMSDADREQRQALVDDLYSVAKANITDGRKMSGDRFDALVDSRIVFTAEDALKEGLVDTLARWTNIDDVLKNYLGQKPGYAKKGMLEGEMLPYATWSEPPQIAVIYALGACAMDDGIRARELEKSVTAAVKSSKVKAIVLRVDSPGGDAMASDYVSEALKGAKGKKPVIVSQADVAASGGYWISMYSDAIVAAPNTVTGSIGVIGGWMYDKGLKEKIGGSTDFVKAGKYADLGFGFTMPLIGLSIPDRQMNETEKGMIESMIRGYYKEFVTKVAEGRGKGFDEIEKVAQGRVWSGLDGKEIGLVDHIGGIEFAIALAKEKAGIPKEKEITVKEISVQPYFNFGDILSMFKGVKETVEEDPMVQQIKFRLDHNGRAIPMLPIDDMEIQSR